MRTTPRPIAKMSTFPPSECPDSHLTHVTCPQRSNWSLRTCRIDLASTSQIRRTSSSPDVFLQWKLLGIFLALCAYPRSLSTFHLEWMWDSLLPQYDRENVPQGDSPLIAFSIPSRWCFMYIVITIEGLLRILLNTIGTVCWMDCVCEWCAHWNRRSVGAHLMAFSVMTHNDCCDRYQQMSGRAPLGRCIYINSRVINAHYW